MRWGRTLLAGMCGCLVFTHVGEADAQETRAASLVTIGFSNLVARLDADRIGFARPEYRVYVLEALRAAGFNAVGAENLVFNRDDAEKADLVLGGTVKELECAMVDERERCRIGIEWQLLDRAQDRVVYRVLTRYMQSAMPRAPELAGKALTLGALSRLLLRPRFSMFARAAGVPLPRDDAFAPATFTPCSNDAHELPRDFEQVADATVMVKTVGGFGSGFFLGSEGLEPILKPLERSDRV